MTKCTVEESRRICALGMALQANETHKEFFRLDEILGAARRIEGWLFSGIVPSEPKCFTQPDPTFKNEVLNDVDA